MVNPVGIGLGLRWEFLEEVVRAPQLEDVSFFEVSPENYMRRGGHYPAELERLRERYPLLTHGLTLSIGASDPPDPSYLAELRREIERLRSPFHSDHLCFSSAGALVFHDLLPLTFTEENLKRVVERVRQVEDALGVPLALENISYYAQLGHNEMSEAEFIARVTAESGAGLVLDVNNVFVNAQNHRFDPEEFIRAMPLDGIVELHVAGHARQPDGLIIDTHGAPVADPVYELLARTLERTGPVPVVLERDNDVPPLAELLAEVRRLRALYDLAIQTHLRSSHAGRA